MGDDCWWAKEMEVFLEDGALCLAAQTKIQNPEAFWAQGKQPAIFNQSTEDQMTVAELWFPFLKKKKKTIHKHKDKQMDL